MGTGLVHVRKSRLPRLEKLKERIISVHAAPPHARQPVPKHHRGESTLEVGQENHPPGGAGAVDFDEGRDMSEGIGAAFEQSGAGRKRIRPMLPCDAHLLGWIRSQHVEGPNQIPGFARKFEPFDKKGIEAGFASSADSRELRLCAPEFDRSTVGKFLPKFQCSDWLFSKTDFEHAMRLLERVETPAIHQIQTAGAGVPRDGQKLAQGFWPGLQVFADFRRGAIFSFCALVKPL